MMATQSIPDFVQKSEQYGMHNARPDPIEFMWGGNRFELPGCDQLSANPVKLDDGTPVPGTLVVKDGYTLDVNQMMPSGPPNWSAKEAIRAVLGIKPGGEATSKLALNGVSYLPLGCTREEYEKVLESGKTRYRESMIGWATDVVQNYEEARNKAKQAGVNALPPGQDFYVAQAVLKEHERRLKEKFGLAEEVETLDDNLQFEVYAKAVAMKMAKSIAELEGVDQMKLVERMLEDPKISANIRKKYSLRKRGYMDPTEAPGAEQPDPVPGE
jgi:hypothetical protein